MNNWTFLMNILWRILRIFWEFFMSEHCKSFYLANEGTELDFVERLEIPLRLIEARWDTSSAFRRVGYVQCDLIIDQWARLQVHSIDVATEKNYSWLYAHCIFIALFNNYPTSCIVLLVSRYSKKVTITI